MTYSMGRSTTSQEEPKDLRLHLHNTFLHVKDQTVEAKKMSRSHSGPALSHSSRGSSGSQDEMPEEPMVPIGPGHWLSEARNQDSDTHSAAASFSGQSSHSVRVSTEATSTVPRDSVEGHKSPLDHKVFNYQYGSHSDSSDAGEPLTASAGASVCSPLQKATKTVRESPLTENAGSSSTAPQSEGVPGCKTCAWVQRVGAVGPCRKCVPKGPITWSKALIARKKAEEKKKRAGYEGGDGGHGDASTCPKSSSTSSSAAAPAVLPAGPVTRHASVDTEKNDNNGSIPKPGSSAWVRL